jgi:hypothetical protein
MIEIQPQKPGDPLLQVYDSIDELSTAIGQNQSHGFFDPRSNTIVATWDSVAHELGHFKDFQSGRMKNPRLATKPEEQASATIRNEIVAILYSHQKTGVPSGLLAYETDFLEWFYLEQKRKQFSQWPEEFKDWTFPQIQDFAEWAAHPQRDWCARLEFIFRDYLTQHHFMLTYQSGS